MQQDLLQPYLGKTNLKSSIAELSVVQGTAKDSGNVYYAVELKFINGYSKRLFLRNEEKFAWANAFDQIQAQQEMDSNF